MTCLWGVVSLVWAVYSVLVRNSAQVQVYQNGRPVKKWQLRRKD